MELRQRNQEAMRRIGYRYIYQRMTQVGTFSGLAATPAQSIRRAPFEDVLAELSIENAMA